MKWQQGEFTVSDAHASLDVAAIHAFLQESYWARGIPRATVERALAHSLCFGLFHRDTQVGFCRAVTDRATFAYLADVFVLECWRGRGLGQWLIACVLAHPELQGLCRWMLVTLDAQGLYRQHGFVPVRNPEGVMEIADADIYLRAI